MPKFGDNSTGGMGQSAIEKTYISYGIEGVLQLYNRILNASVTTSINNLSKGLSHRPFIPDSAKEKETSERLTMIEGFELARQYMENNIYFMFDAIETKYEHELAPDEIKEINLAIAEMKIDDIDIPVKQRFAALNGQIRELAKDENNKEKIEMLTRMRNELAIKVRKKTLEIVNQKRGRLLNEDENPIIEQADYNDERLRWQSQINEPHNVHTRIINTDDGLKGVRISSDMLRLFSKNNKIGTGLDFLDSALERTEPTDRLSLGQDVLLLEQFKQYVRLVEMYKQTGLLIPKTKEEYRDGDKRIVIPDRYVMDLTDISKYPGLQKFIEQLQQYYDIERSKNVKVNREYTSTAYFHDQKSEFAMEQINSGKESLGFNDPVKAKKSETPVFSEQEIGKATIHTTLEKKRETEGVGASDMREIEQEKGFSEKGE